jgi:DDE superfamily endonuclease
MTNFFSQIVSLPNLQIIDFSFGHTGSTHDASAWEATRLAQDREELMEENEWVWADSAYPVNIFECFRVQLIDLLFYMSWMADKYMDHCSLQGSRAQPT